MELEQIKNKLFQQSKIRKNNMENIILTAFMFTCLVEQPTEGKTFYTHPDFTVYADHVERKGYFATVDVQTGGIESTASFDKYYKAPLFEPTVRTEIWAPSPDISGFPQFKSAYPILDSVYQMALNVTLDMVNTPPVGLLNASTGRSPWVRDTSYVVLDGMTHFFPSACRASLESTADKASTVEPEQMYEAMGWTSLGLGIPGYQPCYSMTDFVIWIPAAMEYALTAHDQDFLEDYYECMRRTAGLVRNDKFDPVDGLYDGGETIADGTTAYPANTVGVVPLKGSSVNLIHYQVLRTLVRAGELLGRPVAERDEYQRQASRLNAAINRELWLKNRGFYSLLKENRQKYAVERASGMANALAVLFHAATPQQQAMELENFPDQKWGAPLLWPSWMDRVGYHDQNMWPNVDANWAVASALAGDPNRLTKSLAVLSVRHLLVEFIFRHHSV